VSQSDHPTAGRGFTVGDRVRVRPGVADPDFPDLPLGGWAGTVAEVDDRSPPTYRVRWGRETLLAVHPVHRKRAERDGFEIGEMWLGAGDLEPDDGAKVAVEQPTNITTKPLSMADQDDRIRSVFGLTSDDPLPDVGEGTLRAFHGYLSHHLRFPIEARWEPESGPAQPVTILRLSDPDADLWADGMCGLLCQAKLKGEGIEIALADCEAKAGSPGRQPLADYGYWFGNFG
jgi:hypothetical protein